MANIFKPIALLLVGAAILGAIALGIAIPVGFVIS